MLVDFEVTQKHIDVGLCISAHCCAVALCIQEKLDRYAGVTSRCITIYSERPSERSLNDQFNLDLVICIDSIPYKLTEWIRRFDNNKKIGCHPIKFQLEIPDEYCTDIK